METTQRHGSVPPVAPEQGSEVPDTGTADRAAAWLGGEGDLVTAGMGRSVPVGVQLGVLAHADLDRLRDLGRYCRRGSVRRTWGTDMARLAGDLADAAGSPEELDRIQSEVLVPLELDVLAGRRVVAGRHDLISYLRDRLQSTETGPYDPEGGRLC